VIVNCLAERIELRARELSLPVSLELVQQLERYWELLAKWNRRVNLTALPLDSFPAHSIDRLLIEPLIAASALDVLSSRVVWLDFGSGGGSPAVPMKVAKPAVVLLMVEARSRKCAFLREVAQALALPEATVLCSRVEELADDRAHSADLVTIRAVKLDRRLASRASWALKPGGTLALFGTTSLRTPPVSELTYESSIPLAFPGTELHIFKNES
jgi:16S rRNA (guanine527-N7)-methyltransferase